MNDLEKEFVPYELALRMKALIFDEPCFGYWSTKYISSYEILEPKLFISENIEESALIRRREISCQAFTYSQAFRWFREKYNIQSEVVYVKPSSTDPEENYMCKVDEALLWVVTNTYEEAELACLIKLIEIVESK